MNDAFSYNQYKIFTLTTSFRSNLSFFIRLFRLVSYFSFEQKT